LKIFKNKKREKYDGSSFQQVAVFGLLRWTMFRHRPLELSAQFMTTMIPAHYWLIGTILADLDKNWNAIL